MVMSEKIRRYSTKQLGERPKATLRASVCFIFPTSLVAKLCGCALPPLIQRYQFRVTEDLKFPSFIQGPPTIDPETGPGRGYRSFALGPKGLWAGCCAISMKPRARPTVATAARRSTRGTKTRMGIVHPANRSGI